MPRRGLVVGWMPTSQRSATLAERLGFRLVLLGRSGFRRPWTAPLAYPVLAGRTLWTLARRRPGAIVVVAPPPFPALLVTVAARLLRARVAIDVHSGALLDRRWRWSIPLLAWAGRRAAATVVTLESLAGLLRGRGVETLVIPDPLPAVPPPAVPAPSVSTDAPGGAATAQEPDATPMVVAVCGRGDDEPVEALVAAAAGGAWRLVVTGRPRRAIEATDNVRFAGFLEDAAYHALLASADLVVVLTERDQTLLSGAWEALAHGRPLVVSGTASLRATFGDEVACAGATPDSIRGCIEAALADPGRVDHVRELAARFRSENDEALRGLARRLRIVLPDDERSPAAPARA